MALPQGINFRSTAGYVTDGANEDYELCGTYGNYPRTSAQGNSVGWEGGGSYADSRNRNSAIDRRLAGIGFPDGSAAQDYRIDLPSSGNYNIRLAAGDDTYAGAVAVSLYDTTSLLSALSTGSTSAAGRFKDATDTEYTSANWPGSNSPYAATFSTTICRFRFATGATNRAAHVYVESAGGATGQPTMRRFGGVPGMTPGPQSFGRGW